MLRADRCQRWLKVQLSRYSSIDRNHGPASRSVGARRVPQRMPGGPAIAAACEADARRLAGASGLAPPRSRHASGWTGWPEGRPAPEIGGLDLFVVRQFSARAVHHHPPGLQHIGPRRFAHGHLGKHPAAFRDVGDTRLGDLCKPAVL